VAAGCARLAAALPDSLDGHARRKTTPRSVTTAAWGDPPIVMRCGVGVPAAYSPVSEQYVINGVAWLPERLTKGFLFTTVGRVPGVELAVPDHYQPEINPLTDLATVVGRQIPPAAGPASPTATSPTATSPAATSPTATPTAGR
jgi:hypothetical protein